MHDLASQTLFLKQESDTASPRSIVPVYFVHGMDTLFCPNPLCICHQNLLEVETLLLAVETEILTLQRSDKFTQEAF